MIKRTLYFGNPAYLKTRDEQIVIEVADTKEEITVPIEDAGIVILGHQQITITQALISKLLENNVALITCDKTHHPTGLLLNLEGNQLQSEKFRHQVEASVPLKKQLWQQTITAKIKNQSILLQKRGIDVKNMIHWSKSVSSGDAENHEARAAAYYWKNIFDSSFNFYRDRYGEPPNNLLNYGYAILRATVARSLVGSGLLPTFGIHHHNKYNAYCLADDIMEPYRPYVDAIVCNILDGDEDFGELTPSLKKELLQIPAITITIEGDKSPLMIGLQRTTSSLAKCFEGKAKKIIYPEMDGTK